MAKEYIYNGFEIDEEPPESFARRIQDEVKHIGGCVTDSWRHGDPTLGVAKVTVAFQNRHNLESWIRIYYTQGGLDPDDIEEEVAKIQEA
ncbi:hypothetical protein IC232_13820 [Microvirga sp. BT688]|uniref:hypothetical protein n=1 Tax=Microvirga sp. TaxID=1873136 RepID=UPI00168213FD|nr:hypothetical protein [Microvirga sp.]MBD2747777.1 hypothetical protein [Microvirga sp.]